MKFIEENFLPVKIQIRPTISGVTGVHWQQRR